MLNIKEYPPKRITYKKIVVTKTMIINAGSTFFHKDRSQTSWNVINNDKRLKVSYKLPLLFLRPNPSRSASWLAPPPLRRRFATSPPPFKTQHPSKKLLESESVNSSTFKNRNACCPIHLFTRFPCLHMRKNRVFPRIKCGSLICEEGMQRASFLVAEERERGRGWGKL